MKQATYSFDPATHAHYLNGMRIYGVTTILKAEGFICYPEGAFMADALYRGNYVHAACHLYNQHCLKQETILPEYKGYIDGWQKFCDDEKIKSPESEIKLFSVLWGYAGIADLVVKSERMIDIKTSKTKAPWWKYQTAGYKVAYEEMTRKKTIKERLVVILQSGGTYVIDEHKSRDDERNWLNILTVHKLKMRDGIIKPDQGGDNGSENE